MCEINCSGGCKDCAPDEHAYRDWVEDNPSTRKDEHAPAEKAFLAGWHAAMYYYFDRYSSR